jgi:hypothetical protein
MARPAPGRRRAPARFGGCAPAGSVVEKECIAVRGKHEGDVKGCAIFEALLRAASLKQFPWKLHNRCLNHAGILIRLEITPFFLLFKESRHTLSRAARTMAARSLIENGFCMKLTPSSSTPWWAMTSAV